MAESPGKQFGALVEPWLDRLFRAAYRLTGNKTDAQDLVQDTCVRAFTNGEAFQASDSPIAWLMRVQYNLFIDGTRRRQLAPTRSVEAVDYGNLAVDERADPAAIASDDEQLAAVQRASMALNRDQRALLALSLEGYSLAEMSQITGFNTGVVQSRLHRARKSLIRHLKAESVDLDGPATVGTR